MKQTRLANRYAKALFELALEQKKLDQVGADMALIAQTIEENKELANMLKSPVIKLEKKEKVMESLFGKSTDAISLRFMILVAKKSREEYLVYFAQEFTHIYKDYQGLIDAWITTAGDIEAEVKEAVLVLLKKISGKSIILHESINADILGGFVVKVGDYQYDASTRTLMRKLKEDFSKNLFVGKI
jgi:F-type H+-transporting ATPase subunit delta